MWDFLIASKYLLEVGGKKQIAGIENSFVIKDDI